MNKPQRSMTAMFGGTILIILLVGAAAESKPPNLKQFLMLTGDEAKSMELLECVNHKFGSLEDGVKELKKRLENKPAGQIAFVQFCHYDQIRSVSAAASLVPLASINPFSKPSDTKPPPDTLIWPGFDHPLINKVRELRMLARKTRMLARIDFPASEIAYFRELRLRRPTFEEIRWLVYAAIGADFKGFVWLKGGISSYEAIRLRRLETNLKKYADDLGSARPVGWVKASEGQPISALASADRLFVILLNPAYLNQLGKNKTVALPLGNTRQQGRIVLSPPAGVSVICGSTLSGIPLKLSNDGKRVRAEYRFTGGGKILVFQIASHRQSTKPVEEKK